MRPVITVLIAVLITLSSRAQGENHPGFRSMILKGVEFAYNNPDSLTKSYFVKLKYNRKGQEIEETLVENDLFFHTAKTKYYRNGKQKSIRRLDENGKEISNLKFNYSYDPERKLHKTVAIDGNHATESITEDSLDQQGNILVTYTTLVEYDLHSTEFKAYDQENREIAFRLYYDDEFQFSISSRYNENGWISESEIDCEEEWFRGLYQSTYSELDDQNNWLKRSETQNGVLVSVVNRTIVYR